MPSPSKKPKRQNTLVVKLHDHEETTLLQLAENDMRQPSDLIRYWIEAAKEGRLSITPKQVILCGERDGR